MPHSLFSQNFPLSQSSWAKCVSKGLAEALAKYIPVQQAVQTSHKPRIWVNTAECRKSDLKKWNLWNSNLRRLPRTVDDVVLGKAEALSYLAQAYYI